MSSTPISSNPAPATAPAAALRPQQGPHQEPQKGPGHGSAHPPDHEGEHEGEHGPEPMDLVRIGLVALAATASWFAVWRAFAGFDAIGLVAALAGGLPIYREALSALAAGRMTMELSMSIAIAAALVIGEHFTAAVIVLFVLVAEVLEGLTVRRGRQAIQRLVDLLPRTALVRRNGADREVDAEQVAAGELVIVKPGSRIAVDGLVIAGHSFVDQATITGESIPVEKLSGTHVFAGTINQAGTLEVQTTGVGRCTAFGRIIEAVERAERSRAPIQKTADRLAGYLVYFALAAAASTFAVTHDARSTIAVVIVAGACGIAAGTPLAILGAIGRAARAGAIIKGGLYLEELGRVDTIVLDKTGTVTFGTPEVLNVVCADHSSIDAVLRTAAIGEKRSEHPLAGAILRRAHSAGLPCLDPDRFHYTPGGGISCSHAGEEILVGSRVFLQDGGIDLTGFSPPPEGLSEVLVASGGRSIGAIHIADVMRPKAAHAVQALRGMGVGTHLLTGDTPAIAGDVAAKLGVDEVEGNLRPEEKLRRVIELQATGKTVAMVGDGVNDAPALMQANVGIAMGSGTDVAMESASIILIGNDLSKLVETVRIARACRRIILQNFVGTLAVDAAGVALASMGFLSPLLAAFIHVTSELVFILNSTRLLPRPAARGRESPQPVLATESGRTAR